MNTNDIANQIEQAEEMLSNRRDALDELALKAVNISTTNDMLVVAKDELERGRTLSNESIDLINLSLESVASYFDDIPDVVNGIKQHEDQISDINKLRDAIAKSDAGDALPALNAFMHARESEHENRYKMPNDISEVAERLRDLVEKSESWDDSGYVKLPAIRTAMIFGGRNNYDLDAFKETVIDIPFRINYVINRIVDAYRESNAVYLSTIQGKASHYKATLNAIERLPTLKAVLGKVAPVGSIIKHHSNTFSYISKPNDNMFSRNATLYDWLYRDTFRILHDTRLIKSAPATVRTLSKEECITMLDSVVELTDLTTAYMMKSYDELSKQKNQMRALTNKTTLFSQVPWNVDDPCPLEYAYVIAGYTLGGIDRWVDGSALAMWSGLNAHLAYVEASYDAATR